MVSRSRSSGAGGRYGGVPVSRDQRQIIEQSFRQGLSREQTLDRLRAGGRGLRTLAVSEIRREIRQRDARQPALAALDVRFRPGTPEITQTSRRLATNYSYKGTVFGRNTLTGDRMPIHVNFGDDQILTREQIEARFNEIVNKGGSQARDEQQGSVSVDIESVEINSIETFAGNL